MNKKKFTLDNLYQGLEDEKKEVEKFEKDEISLIDDFLRTRYGKKRIPQIREGISLPVEDVNFVKSLRERIVKINPKLMPNKSQLYRLGLYQLKDKTDKELVILYMKLLEESDN